MEQILYMDYSADFSIRDAAGCGNARVCEMRAHTHIHVRGLQPLPAVHRVSSLCSGGLDESQQGRVMPLELLPLHTCRVKKKLSLYLCASVGAVLRPLKKDRLFIESGYSHVPQQ